MIEYDVRLMGALKRPAGWNAERHFEASNHSRRHGTALNRG